MRSATERANGLHREVITARQLIAERVQKDS
jgi:hypothetical protein